MGLKLLSCFIFLTFLHFIQIDARSCPCETSSKSTPPSFKDRLKSYVQRGACMVGSGLSSGMAAARSFGSTVYNATGKAYNQLANTPVGQKVVGGVTTGTEFVLRKGQSAASTLKDWFSCPSTPKPPCKK